MYEKEFDIISEERQACLDIINRCQSEEKRCRLVIDSISQSQKKQVVAEEMARKVSISLVLNDIESNLTVLCLDSN
jgi:hypothetical protein